MSERSHEAGDDMLRAAVAEAIHQAEGRDWPDESPDPAGGCLGGDRCRFVAGAVLTVLREKGALSRAAGYGTDPDDTIRTQPEEKP